MAMSAATPMKTPSMVSADRILLRASAWNAAATIIKAKARAVPAFRATAGSGCGGPGSEPAGSTPADAAGGGRTAGFRSSDITSPSRMVMTRSV